MRKTEAGLVAIVFLVLALAVASNYGSPSVTGFASINPIHSIPSIPSYDNVSATVLEFANDKSFEYLGDKALFCVVVEMDNETTYYYELVKYNGEAYVKESYCAWPLQDNIIVKFNSYEDLTEFKNNPKQFVAEKMNMGYYLFPSNYIIHGGNLRCSEEFKEKYCGGFFNYFSGSEIKDLGVPCCANQFTPTGMAFIFGSVVKTSGIFLIILIAIIIVMLLISRKKKINLV